MLLQVTYVANISLLICRHTIYSIKNDQPCMDHDRQSGEVQINDSCYSHMRIRTYVYMYLVGSGNTRIYINKNETDETVP